jgi:nucleoside-diphosphate-sugar epimerase
MKCLVTGASGSIGSRIVKRLIEEGHQVRALVRATSRLDYLDREKVEIFRGDMAERASLDKAVREIDWIFHSAAPVDDWAPPELFQRINIDGNRLLLDACRKVELKRFVYVSSVMVYGVNPPENTSEKTPYQACGIPYCDTKIEAEEIFFRAHREKGFPVTVLRPSNVWGPTANAWTLRPIEKLLAGEVRLIDGGRGSFNSSYVDNFADACLLSAEHPRAVGEGFIVTDNFGPIDFKFFFDRLADLAEIPRVTRSVPKWVASLAARIFETKAKLTGGRPQITRFAIDMLTKNCHYNSTKIRTELGYRSRCGLEDGFAETKKWLKERRII